MLVIVAAAQATGGVYHGGGGDTISMDSNFQSSLLQNTTAIGGGNADSLSTSTALAEGGSADSWSYSEGGIGWSDSTSSVNIATTSISNYKGRTSPVGAYPPYLPSWNHGGWGTINAYFPNGPTGSDKVYQRTFDTANPDDVRELKGILGSLSYVGPLELVGGMFNGLVKLFGGPDKTHRGRGVEIANSVLRDRRPEGKPMFVLIDSNVDGQLLTEAGYAYVGRISLEGSVKRNWDQVYHAAIAEALPWDVDILLISGGMKGVTVGSNTSFPNGGGAFSQTNYSLTLLGGRATGITEGKGEAMVSAAAYRYCPEMIARRSVPAALYERIRVRPKAAAATDGENVMIGVASREAVTQTKAPIAGVEVSRELYDRAGLRPTTPPVETTIMR
jgi:hypothetical protein